MRRGPEGACLENNHISTYNVIQGFEVLEDEESGFMFRRKRQKVPTPKKKSTQKKDRSGLLFQRFLIDALTPTTHALLERHINESTSPAVVDILTKYVDRILSEEGIMKLTRTPPITKDTLTSKFQNYMLCLEFGLSRTSWESDEGHEGGLQSESGGFC